MGRFYKFNSFQRLVLSAVFCTFSMAAIIPSPIYARPSPAGINNVEFGVKVQKLIDKAWKCYNKSDSDGLLDVILEIKSKVEAYTGRKIDLSKEIDKIESDVRKKSNKPPKDIFKKFKNLVQNKSKKKSQRNTSIESYFIDEPNMSF